MTILRVLTPADASAIRRIYSGAAVTYLMRPEMTAPEADAYVAQVIEWSRATPVAQYVLGVDVAGDLVGVVKLGRRPAGHGRVSYVLREDTWGRGYATAAVEQLAASAFTAAALDSLGAKHHPDNPASGRVLTKAGFTCLGADGGFVHYWLDHDRR
ncbi:GNAT family N-acetyltransferase [Streptomyces sp. C]|uniref:GNAT family N-acetyltransferase n=1 Tax=Streptomyces sp. C TaxID=253839 RepID=UPI0001B57CA8|nr:GNAT family N-acetyltransferase [Streptomyces sp. C]EFL15754.1 acetyltransferase [Streptomyces sp. C]